MPVRFPGQEHRNTRHSVADCCRNAGNRSQEADKNHQPYDDRKQRRPPDTERTLAECGKAEQSLGNCAEGNCKPK